MGKPCIDCGVPGLTLLCDMCKAWRRSRRAS